MYPHTVIFQSLVEVPDGGGGYVKNWEDTITIEAHVQAVSGTEYTRAQQLTNPSNHNIYYPFTEGVIPSMRAYWVDRDKTLSLQSKPLDQGGMGEIMLVKAQL